MRIKPLLIEVAVKYVKDILTTSLLQMERIKDSDLMTGKGKKLRPQSLTNCK